jgi:hypothetical protein
MGNGNTLSYTTPVEVSVSYAVPGAIVTGLVKSVTHGLAIISYQACETGWGGDMCNTTICCKFLFHSCILTSV